MKPRLSRPELLTTVNKLEALTEDLSDILFGSVPQPDVLAKAPLLDSWRIGLVFSPVLIGHVVGHPRVPDGAVTTSEVWLMDEGKRWARSFSRFYRLGDVGSERDEAPWDLEAGTNRPQPPKASQKGRS